ncbi:MAG: twin-arginine translocation signal domain-containing protein, partial [Pseudomonadota bacterium]
MTPVLTRRDMIRSATLAGGGLAFSAWMPAWAQPVSSGIVKPLPTVSGNDIALTIARQTMVIDGRKMRAIGVNGTVPAPLVRLR